METKKEFTRNGITLVFYKRPHDEKYSFLIKDDPSMTEKILNTVKNKRIKEKDIYYCEEAVFDLIKNNKLDQKDEIDQDYISIVKEKLDSLQSKNTPFDLEELPLSVNQKAHEVTFTIIFNGKRIAKTATNKKIAKQLCYKTIISERLIG